MIDIKSSLPTFSDASHSKIPSENERVTTTDSPLYSQNVKILNQIGGNAGAFSWISQFFSNMATKAVNSYAFYDTNLTLERMKSLVTDSQRPSGYRKIVPMHFLGQTAFVITDRKIGNHILSLQRNCPDSGESENKGLINGGRLIHVFYKLMGPNILTTPPHRNHDFRQAFKPFLVDSPETKYAQALQKYADQAIDHWIGQGNPVNISEEIPKFATGAVAQNILGYEGRIDEVSDAINTLAHRIRSDFFHIPQWMSRINVTWAKRTLENAFLQVKDKKDYLIHGLTNNSTVKPSFSDEEIKSTGEMMLFGGRDTTASLAIWALSQLGRDPSIQKVLYKEWKEAEAKGISLTAHVASQETLLHAFLLECIRTNPPSFFQPREATKDCYINDPESKESIFIPKNSMLLISNYFINRDKQNYPEPEKFNFYRFVSQKEANKPAAPPPNAFSVGPNMCLGQRFARLEVKTLVLSLIIRCQWTCVDPNIQQVAKSVMWTKEDVKIKLTPRGDKQEI
jgi:cytochrome P450